MKKLTIAKGVKLVSISFLTFLITFATSTWAVDLAENKQTASDGVVNDNYGSGSAISGDTAVIGAYNEGGNGSAYILYRNQGGTNNWGELKKIVASDDTGQGDVFGGTVSINGDIVVVSAYNDDDIASNAGAAYIFYRDQGGADNWGEVKKITASDGVINDTFGNSDVSGSTLIIGASQHDQAANNAGAAYIFYRDQGGSDNWGQVKKLVPADLIAGSNFGYSVSIDGDYAAVGAYNDDDGGLSAGAVYVFYRNSDGAGGTLADNWGQVAKLIPSDTANYLGFGRSVSISGDYVAAGTGASSAYVFYRNQGGSDNWGQLKKIRPSDGINGSFGNAMSLYGDNLIIGAYGDNSYSGSAYLYNRNAGGTDNWGEVTKIIPSDTFSGQGFGDRLGITDEYIVGGTPNDDSYTGAAYFFAVPPLTPTNLDMTAYSGGTTATLTWNDNATDETEYRIYQATTNTQPGTPTYTAAANAVSQAVTGISDVDLNHFWVSAYNSSNESESVVAEVCLYKQSYFGKLIPCDGAAGDSFGNAVDIEGDYAVVAAVSNDGGVSNSGAIYIFKKIFDDTWLQMKKIKAPDLAADDQFGYSVAMDGDYIIVGAQYENSNGLAYRGGSAYIFYRNEGGTNNWGYQAKLVASDPAAYDYFGYSVDIDENRVIVGADENDDTASTSGSAYIFERSGSTWTQVKKLVSSSPQANARFGYSVAIDGNYAVVGANGDDSFAGAGYVFYVDEGGVGNWGQVARLLASDRGASDYMGRSIDIDGDNVVLGADGDDDNGTDAGALYLFNRNQGGADSWGQVKKINGTSNNASDNLGYSVEIKGDYIIGGAYARDAALIFYKDQGTPDSWGEKHFIMASDYGSYDSFGADVALDAVNVMIGGPYNDDQGSASGSAYIFDYANNISNEFGVLRNCVRQAIDNTRSGSPGWIYPAEVSALTTLSCDSVSGDFLNGPEYLTNLTDLTFTGLAHLDDYSGLASGNTNLAAFASGLTLTIEDARTFAPNAESAVDELHLLEANGATINHTVEYEDCSNGLDDDDDGQIDGDDLYCRQPVFYVDFDAGTMNYECSETNPCDDLYNVMTSHMESRAYEVINAAHLYPGTQMQINVRGDETGSTTIQNQTGYTTNYTDVLVQPWGTATPSISGGTMSIQQEYITLSGFELNGVNIYAYSPNITIRDNYFHGASGFVVNFYSTDGKAFNNLFADNLGGPIVIYGANALVYNNIFANNRATSNSQCGGVTAYSGGYSILNNTFYNNCSSVQTNNRDIYASADGTIKQNIIYNDIGGQTYYYNQGLTINGVAVGGTPISGQAAADHGTGYNFLASTMPYVNPYMTYSREAATVGLGLSVNEYTNYQIPNASMVTGVSGLEYDATGLDRPDPTGSDPEAGALEYQTPPAGICGNGLIDAGETCDDGNNFDDNNGCSIMCTAAPINFYVDYDSGTDNDNCTEASPCDMIDSAINSADLTAYAESTPAKDIVVNVRGTFSLSDDGVAFGGTETSGTSFTLQPWGDTTPTIQGNSLELAEANITVNGFLIDEGMIEAYYDNVIIDGVEVRAGGAARPGAVIMHGDNSIVRNSYMHGHSLDKGVVLTGSNSSSAYNNFVQGNASWGIDIQSSNDVKIYNNILSENGIEGDPYCGGVQVSGSSEDAEVFNNSFYNNCYASHIANDQADLRIDANGVGTTNIVAKNNLFFNDLGGETVYLDGTFTEQVNGVSLAGAVQLGQTALDLVGGENFIAATNPYSTPVTAISWTAAGNAFVLLSRADYLISSLDPSTPETDYLGNSRTAGTAVAGALETASISGGGSNTVTPPTCDIFPTRLDLPDTLPVSQIGGTTAVEINWGKAGFTEMTSAEKISTFLDYLNSSDPPTIGAGKKKLEDVYLVALYNKIAEDEDLLRVFDERLSLISNGKYRHGDEMNIQVCDQEVMDVLRVTIRNMIDRGGVKDEVNALILEFVDELMEVEEVLQTAGGQEMPFLACFNRENANLSSKGTLKIYRDDQLIFSESNSDRTSYTDTSLPVNSSGRVKYYQYKIVTSTECGSEEGSLGKAQIDPIIPQGTEVDVTVDLKIKIKKVYDLLIMERLRKLFEENSVQSASSDTESISASCKEIKTGFLKTHNIDAALGFITACYGEGDTKLISRIEESHSSLVNPLLIHLGKNRNGDVERSADEFLSPLIEDIKAQLAVEDEVYKSIRDSKANIGRLLQKQSIEELTDEEKELIKTAFGEDFFSITGATHAADILVQKYDENMNLIEEYPVRTDIFGEASLSLGTMEAQKDYTLKVTLTDIRYMLPKSAQVIIMNAAKEGTMYHADIALYFDKEFRHGNFDESGNDEEINLQDLLAWIEIIRSHPELWKQINVDGDKDFNINLSDAAALLFNWGTQESSILGQDRITLSELFTLFGLSISNSRSDLSQMIEIPEWVSLTEGCCTE